MPKRKCSSLNRHTHATPGTSWMKNLLLQMGARSERDAAVTCSMVERRWCVVSLNPGTEGKMSEGIMSSLFGSVQRVGAGSFRACVGRKEQARPSEQGCVIGSVF